jgi:hypothetical protein
MTLKNEATGSQVRMILAYLRQGKTITQEEAKALYGCARLASRINDIKNKGIEVKRRMQPGLNRYGKTVKYAVYWIEPERQQSEAA